ncbi:suppressor APC domain-containing protein 2 [Pteropus vampyrus]|uniref:Suppressor APC domain-containing protein 2 n=1 Tax=Pteropus vampyrus TaxID=132908 RepID=A0A6P6CY57_PTEVA|nr:suppressor APC domain-containing protein 2 [Pteropus vampyrus]
MGAAEAPELLTECTAPPRGPGTDHGAAPAWEKSGLCHAQLHVVPAQTHRARLPGKGRGRPEAPHLLTLSIPAAFEPKVGTGVQRRLGKPCPRKLTPSSCAHAHVGCAGVQPHGPPQGRWGPSGDQTPARHGGEVWAGLGCCLRPQAGLRWGGAQIGSELPMTVEVCRPGSRLCIAGAVGEWSGRTWSQAVGVELDWTVLTSAAGAVACRAWEPGVGDAWRAPRARGQRRRHTITNGVDCDLLKQMAELEQEKEVLLQGLQMMARGRDWYQQQLQRVQERQRRLGRNRASADFGAEGSPPPLGRLLPKVQEVARCLGELLAAACAGRALPSSSSGPPCPSMAPASPSASGWQQQTILMLKEQNRLLTQEVTDKSERITQLEQEKCALIKQLFEARALSQQDAGPLDSTFI